MSIVLATRVSDYLATGVDWYQFALNLSLFSICYILASIVRTSPEDKDFGTNPSCEPDGHCCSLKKDEQEQYKTMNMVGPPLADNRQGHNMGTKFNLCKKCSEQMTGPSTITFE